MKQDKINFLVGFGGIVICSIIPRVAVYYVDEKAFCKMSAVAILSMLLLTAVFLSYTRKTVSKLNYNDHLYTVIWVLGIHVLIFIFSVRQVLGTEPSVSKEIITQIIFGISSLSSTLDFIVVWNNGFHLQAPRPVEARNVVQMETSRYSLTDFTAITLGCLSILTLIFGFWILGGATVLMTVVICAVVFGGVHGLAVISKGVSARGKMLSGLGAMGIIGFIPRIVHGTLVDANMQNLFFSISFTLSLTLSIYYHFIYSNRPPFFHFQYNAHESIITKFAVIHSIILLAMIRISYGHWENEELEVIIFSQLAFFLLPLTCAIDFSMVWNDTVVYSHPLEDGKTEVKSLTKPKMVKKQKTVKLRPPRVTCFSCHQGYNEDNKSPRILKECGHTICEKCANKLLARNHWKHLFCPKCEMVTVVKGKANILTKNYLLLELVEEARNM